MRADLGTSGFEPVIIRHKRRSGLQFTFESLLKFALVASLFIPLALYVFKQDVDPKTVLMATMGGLAALVFFFARWTEGAYDPPRTRRFGGK
jgi:hypothetical protein